MVVNAPSAGHMRTRQFITATGIKGIGSPRTWSRFAGGITRRSTIKTGRKREGGDYATTMRVFARNYSACKIASSRRKGCSVPPSLTNRKMEDILAIFLGVDLMRHYPAAVLVEAERGDPPRVRGIMWWQSWDVTEIMKTLRKWLDFYPNAHVGYEKAFSMPGRSKTANSQFGMTKELLKALVKIGVEPIEVGFRTAQHAEEARQKLRLTSPAFRQMLDSKEEKTEHILDAAAVAVALQGELQAARFERKLEKVGL